VTTTRQLAMFRKQLLGYKHLNSVIQEAKKFKDYLTEVQGNFTANKVKKAKQER
jgi:hypothetical protein